MLANFTITSEARNAAFNDVRRTAEELAAATRAIAPNATTEPTPAESSDAKPVKDKAKITGRKDIDDAAAKLGWTMGSKREIRKLPEHLQHNETVEMMATGRYTDKSGIVVITTERVIFLVDGWTGSSTADFPISSISSVSWSSRFGTGDLTIHASGNVSTISGILSADGTRMRDAVREKINNKNTASATTTIVQSAAPAPEESPADTLKKLAELHQMGAITDDEYNSKKQELLDRL